MRNRRRMRVFGVGNKLGRNENNWIIHLNLDKADFGSQIEVSLSRLTAGNKCLFSIVGFAFLLSRAATTRETRKHEWNMRPNLQNQSELLSCKNLCKLSSNNEKCFYATAIRSHTTREQATIGDKISSRKAVSAAVQNVSRLSLAVEVFQGDFARAKSFAVCGHSRSAAQQSLQWKMHFQ